MKINKILKAVLIILILIAICIIGFLGIYIENKNTMKNIVPEYILGKDFLGYRKVVLEVDTSTSTIKYDENGNIIPSSDTETKVANAVEKKANEDEVLTDSNYEISKKIIEERLKKVNVKDYIISKDKQTGKIVVQIPENDQTDSMVYQLMYQGKFEITDSTTGKVLITNDDIKDVKSGYGTTKSGETSIFVNFEFNKEGTEKFKDITSTYIQTTIPKEDKSKNEENTANNEGIETDQSSEEKTETIKKEIDINIDGQTLLTTYFGETIENGVLQLSFGTSSNLSTQELQERLVSASNMSILLNSGKLPIAYKVIENRYILSDITNNQINFAIYVSIAIVAIIAVYLLIRYKFVGFKMAISLIAYIAILLIAVRLFNVEMSITGIFAIMLSVIFDFVLVDNLAKRKITFWETIKKYSLIFVPAVIIAIVLTLTNIPGGAVLFWGIVLNILYNIIVTKMLID